MRYFSEASPKIRKGGMKFYRLRTCFPSLHKPLIKGGRALIILYMVGAPGVAVNYGHYFPSPKKRTENGIGVTTMFLRQGVKWKRFTRKGVDIGSP